MKRIVAYISLLLPLIYSCGQHVSSSQNNNNQLNLWNNTDAKAAIINFVQSVTDQNSVDFVPQSKRIAVFDNDGTLWIEKPLYIPVEFKLNHIKNNFNTEPTWQDNELYKNIASGNLNILKEYSSGELLNGLFASHNGQSQKAYKKESYDFLSLKKHPRFKKPFKEMTYSPMVQLIEYLQNNNFSVYIVTGGEITFLRTVSSEIYNIPMENVIGTSIRLDYKTTTTGNSLIRTGTIQSANDRQVKPTNIDLHIGQKPIFAAGNSDGDYEMMEYTLSNEDPSMAILIHHDDDEREYKYMHGTEKAIKDADKKGWYVISMEKDFKEIFSK